MKNYPSCVGTTVRLCAGKAYFLLSTRLPICVALMFSFIVFCPPADAQETPTTLATAKARYAKADRALNEAWEQAKKKLSEERFNDLKNIQRQWLVFQREQAEKADEALRSNKIKPQDSAAYQSESARLSEDRTEWLRRLTRGEEEPLTGLWIDGEGGTVSIVEQNNRIFFDLIVVRRRTYNLGVLAGVATWVKTIGWFSDKGRDKEKSEETIVAFCRHGLSLEIVSANAQSYQGKGAFFDGDYFKVSSLNAKEQTEIVRAGESGKSLADP